MTSFLVWLRSFIKNKEQPKFVGITPYDWQKTSVYEYLYTRSDGTVYEIHFEPSHRLFTDACVNCHNIYEIAWFGSNDEACRDARSGRTMVEIIKDFLADDFRDAVLYKCYDDGKIHKREILFDRLIHNYGREDLEKICNESSVKNLADKLCLIVKKDSINYQSSVDDIMQRCSVCPPIGDNC